MGLLHAPAQQQHQNHLKNPQGVSEQWPGAAWKEPTLLLQHKSMQDCGASSWRPIEKEAPTELKLLSTFFFLKSCCNKSTKIFISSNPVVYKVTFLTR